MGIKFDSWFARMIAVWHLLKQGYLKMATDFNPKLLGINFSAIR